MYDLIWWVGAVTIGLAALYGLASGSLWVLDRTLKAFGAWPRTWEVMRRMYRERREADEANGG